jgi:uncharacterized cupin superfamily protein
MSSELKPFNIHSTYVVFDNNGVAIPLEVNDTFWQNLEHKFGDFSGKKLISCFVFDKDWDTWEIHPNGDELACLLSGEVELILEKDGAVSTMQLNTPGSFALIPCGTWHTAKVRSSSSMLFVTPGEGTQNKPA